MGHPIGAERKQGPICITVIQHRNRQSGAQELQRDMARSRWTEVFMLPSGPDSFGQAVVVRQLLQTHVIAQGPQALASMPASGMPVMPCPPVQYMPSMPQESRPAQYPVMGQFAPASSVLGNMPMPRWDGMPFLTQTLPPQDGQPQNSPGWQQGKYPAQMQQQVLVLSNFLEASCREKRRGSKASHGTSQGLGWPMCSLHGTSLDVILLLCM